MNIDAEALVARWELNGNDTKHPAYIIAKAITNYDLETESVMQATREWMHHPHRGYSAPYTWYDVLDVLRLYKIKEVNQ